MIFSLLLLSYEVRYSHGPLSYDMISIPLDLASSLRSPSFRFASFRVMVILYEIEQRVSELDIRAGFQSWTFIN